MTKKHIKLVTLPIICIAVLSLFPVESGAAEKYVSGGFEMSGYLNSGLGWQRFAGGAPTEIANDGSFAGVLGSVLPNVFTGWWPEKGKSYSEGFMEVAEVDLKKSFGDSAHVRADILFGRQRSGSLGSVGAIGMTVEEGYADVQTKTAIPVGFKLGRFAALSGIEAFEPFNNDLISWSIASRSNLYPYVVTGGQISFKFADWFSLNVTANNGFTNDTTFEDWDIPSWFADFAFSWGEDARRNSLVITPFVGPETDSNRPLTFGNTVTFSGWLARAWCLSIEATFRRDNGSGGPNNDYIGAVGNLRWDISKDLYAAVKYAYEKQFEDSNGVLNLTGEKQQINEMSLGGGYYLTDNFKIKFESRFDWINPAAGKSQYVPGVAIALACAF